LVFFRAGPPEMHLVRCPEYVRIAHQPPERGACVALDRVPPRFVSRRAGRNSTDGGSVGTSDRDSPGLVGRAIAADADATGPQARGRHASGESPHFDLGAAVARGGRRAGPGTNRPPDGFTRGRSVDHPVARRRRQPRPVPRRTTARLSRRDPRPPVPRRPLCPSAHVPGRTRRTSSNPRILLWRLLDPGPVSTDLSMLSRPHGSTHEARTSLMDQDIDRVVN